MGNSKRMKYLLMLASAVGLFCWGMAANAMPISGGTTTSSCVLNTPDVTSRVSMTNGCVVVSAGNDSETVVNNQMLFGFDTWVQDGKDDGVNGSTSGQNTLGFLANGSTLGGDWELTSMDAWSDFSQIMLVFKGGNGNITPEGFVAYLLQVDALTGTYQSPFNNANNPANLANISHISVYGVSAVPIPAALPLFLSAIVGLGWFRRRSIHSS